MVSSGQRVLFGFLTNTTMANYRGANDGSEQRTSFKVVLLGEGAVGKTSLVLRYIENKFNDKHISTLQVFY